jgi:hypothetical protein
MWASLTLSLVVNHDQRRRKMRRWKNFLSHAELHVKNNFAILKKFRLSKVKNKKDVRARTWK